jgi:hypothetical protein
MKKHVAAVRLVDRDEATEAVELPEELRLPLGAIASVARAGLLAMCTRVGLAVMGEMMTAEMTAKVGGPKHAKLAQRQGNGHGSAPGSAVVGGRRVPVERPRGRTVTGDEIELATYAAFSNDDLLSQVGMEPMLAGVATRRHARVNEPVGDDLDAQATSTSGSSVSRRFKAATDAQLDELMSRDLSELDLAALMLDGVHFAACCVVALAIGADGTKVPVGLWLGDPENKTVVTALLADLVARGLNTDGGLLVVIDGAKPSPPRCARCSATPRSSSGARCTSAATSATTSRRTNKRGSIASSPPRSTTTIPRRVNVPVGTSPRSSRRVGPMRRRACAKASRTCSPSGGSVSAAGSPRASRTRTASRA